MIKWIKDFQRKWNVFRLRRKLDTITPHRRANCLCRLEKHEKENESCLK